MAFFCSQMLHENEFEMSAASYLLHIFVSVIKNVAAQSLTVFFCCCCFVDFDWK